MEFRHKAPKAEGWFRAYDHEWSGPEAVQAGLKKVWDDSLTTSVTFVVADHHHHGNRVYEVMTISIGSVEGASRWRMGTGGNESTLCWGFSLEDAVANAVYRLAITVGRNTDARIFRQPEGAESAVKRGVAHAPR